MKQERSLTFSIVLPTYNRAGYIERAIRSVLQQVYPHWELIIVDDGSTDQSETVILPFLKDGRIRYIKSEVNRGLSYARNKGISSCLGDFICFLDSDDEYLPERLSCVLPVLLEHSEATSKHLIVFTSTYENTQGENILLKWTPQTESENTQQYLLFNTPSVNTVTIPKDVVKHERFNELFRYDEDIEFYLRLSKKCSFHYVDTPTAIRYIHGSNLADSVQDFYSLKLELFSEILKDQEIKRNLGSRHIKAYRKGIYFRRLSYLNSRKKLSELRKECISYLAKYPLDGRNIYLLKTILKSFVSQ